MPQNTGKIKHIHFIPLQASLQEFDHYGGNSTYLSYGRRPVAYSVWQMKSFDQVKAIVTDSHFLIPLAAFAIGLALLVKLH